MKKLVVVFSLFLFMGTASLLTSCNNDSSAFSDDSVYICNSEGAKRYHKYEDCRGLSNCTHEIDKISKGAAEGKGKTPCRICY